MFGTTVLTIVFIIAIFSLVRSFRIVNQYEKGLIIRLGRYHSTVSSGVVLLVPFIDSLIKLDMREQVISVAPQEVITKDNVLVTVDAVIYYKVVDPIKAQFEIANFPYAATTLAQTNLRNLIGDKLLDETLTARDLINQNLRQTLDESTNAWGVKVTKVELQKIDPPADITSAMSQQMKAEREKRARILEAQGFREAAILKAEGDARGTLLRADAQAQSVKMVADAAEKSFTVRAAQLREFEVAEKVLGGETTKFIIPSNGNIVNVLNLDSQGNIVPIRSK